MMCKLNLVKISSLGFPSDINVVNTNKAGKKDDKYKTWSNEQLHETIQVQHQTQLQT